MGSRTCLTDDSPCHSAGSVSTRFGGGRVELSARFHTSFTSDRGRGLLRSWNRFRISLVVSSVPLLKMVGSFRSVRSSSGT